ncbi:hypothetical protein [Lusitaniella coriacea]
MQKRDGGIPIELPPTQPRRSLTASAPHLAKTEYGGYGGKKDNTSWN